MREVVQPGESLSPANAGEICLRLTENPTDYISDEAMDRRTAFAPRQLRHGIVLGQLYFEGRLVPRDVQEAVRLIDLAGQ